jgi:3-oxoacyl-[acyl-carrier protein] reductase
MGLDNRVAIITGSGRGIGRAIALELARQGAVIVINDVGDAAPAQQVCQEILDKGGRSQVVLADISQAAEASHLVDSALTAYGRVDILVNNAGITRDQLVLRMSDDDWDRVLSINLKGAFLCIKSALRPMIKQRWGRIINIASIAGVVGNPGQANYSAAKAGLIGLTKTVAREVASRGITVNAVAPGAIDTVMLQNLSENIRQEMVKQIPVGRLGTPEDVAHMVAFIASEATSYITGQVFHVDGGMVMA